MKILHDEREHSSIGECEHCGEEKEGRKVEVEGVIFRDEGGRGYWFICFDCFAPRVKWVHASRGPYWSPVEWEED